MSEPCTRADFAGTVVGSPCDDCGHTNLLHPGSHNPALKACVLCEITLITARPKVITFGSDFPDIPTR